MIMNMDGWEIAQIAMATVGGATAILLVLPTPETFAKMWGVETCPLWYLRVYNVTRYIANLNPNAGWQDRKPKTPDKKD